MCQATEFSTPLHSRNATETCKAPRTPSSWRGTRRQPTNVARMCRHADDDDHRAAESKSGRPRGEEEWARGEGRGRVVVAQHSLGWASRINQAPKTRSPPVPIRHTPPHTPQADRHHSAFGRPPWQNLSLPLSERKKGSDVTPSFRGRPLRRSEEGVLHVCIGRRPPPSTQPARICITWRQRNQCCHRGKGDNETAGRPA